MSLADPAPRPSADAILGAASYNRRDFELPVLSLHPSQHDAARFPDLGRLGRLPLEILSLICLSLDVESAVRFSHVNRTAREILASIREFRHLRVHALECLCVLLRTRVASHIDISTLYSVLTARNCSLCNSFGGFFFFPTVKRCCLACIAHAPEMRVTYLSRLADATGVSAGELEKRLPVVRTLHGGFKSVVTVQHALDSMRENGVKDLKAAVSRWPDSLTLRYQATTSLPVVDRRKGEVEYGVSCKGCELAYESHFSDENLELRDRFYSREAFLQHFEQCNAAQKLWVSSRGGTAPVKEPLWVGLRTPDTPRRSIPYICRQPSICLPADELPPPSATPGHTPDDELQNWSSLIGIITAICGNVLIALALNVQRYAHIRLHQKKLQIRERARQAMKNAAGAPQSQAAGRYGAAGTSNGDSSGTANGTTNGSAGGQYHDDDAHGSSETEPLAQSFRSDYSAEDESKAKIASSYLKDPYWWLGQVLITVGEMGNFLAYGFAPASIVSPLGVVALVSNCVIAPIFFKEVFRQRDFWGVLIAMTGAVTVVLSAKTEETKLGPHEVWDAITTMEFEIYMAVSCSLIVLLMWLSPRYGNRTILIDLGLVGLFGGYTALATKGVSSMLSSTLLGAFTTPVTYALVFILLFTAIMQVRYVNKALQRFDSTQVIPIQFVLFTLSVIIGSAVLYRDFERTTLEQAIKFVGGCLFTFFGVFLITSGRPRQDVEDEVTLSDAEGIEETIGLAEQDRAVPPPTPPQRRHVTTPERSRGSSRASRVSFVDDVHNQLAALSGSGVPSSRAPPGAPTQKPFLINADDDDVYSPSPFSSTLSAVVGDKLLAHIDGSGTGALLSYSSSPTPGAHSGAAATRRMTRPGLRNSLFVPLSQDDGSVDGWRGRAGEPSASSGLEGEEDNSNGARMGLRGRARSLSQTLGLTGLFGVGGGGGGGNIKRRATVTARRDVNNRENNIEGAQGGLFGGVLERARTAGGLQRSTETL
ncbi:magnesium transporter NIPA-domain-containing protein [Achaetomium macrosporum]|uniref:Magnesium transporter NIPA-domain-containing protein n=1 Tax=Achaetomium macrosporum TaxID=79813 RepID=A0AAN7CJH7_9PEZI|nr:magnesium transporter NIPA-domain-containing protein [Achaetomium macrosporum]